MEIFRAGAIVTFKGREPCLVVSVHELPDLGIFYDILFSDGRNMLVDGSDLSVLP